MEVMLFVFVLVILVANLVNVVMQLRLAVKLRRWDREEL